MFCLAFIYYISDHNRYQPMMEEKDNSDGSMGSPGQPKIVSRITWKTSLKALLYKSIRIQQRNICSNICQIITPLLCVLFTLVVKLISMELIQIKIQPPSFPRPISLPIVYDILPLNLTCEQIYFFDYDGPSPDINIPNAQAFLNSNLKHYCLDTDSLQPNFTYVPAMNQQMLQILRKVDKESFSQGVEMKGPIPDGIVRFHNLSEQRLDVTLGVNDYRLSQYHRNNGVTKIRYGETFFSYVMTTEGMMSMIQKVSRPFLQKTNPKQIIFGSYMYMPFDGQDTSMMDKTVNVVGSGLYPLGLSLLLPLFLYAIVSEKEQKLIEVMRMNGLNIKYYWVSTFIFNFVLSMITFAIFYFFGRVLLELTFFVETDWLLMWLMLVGWGLSQIAMTNLVQIFIFNGKSATIIGYLLSIFSTLVGESIAVFIYAFPLQVPLLLLLYPPFCLCRIIYLMGLACSSTGCYSSVASAGGEILTCIGILYGWSLVFLFSIWLDGQVQQEYGVAHKSAMVRIIERFILRKKESYNQNNRQTMEFQLKEQGQIMDKDSTVSEIKPHDSSVDRMREEVESMGIHDRQLIIKELMKKYQTTNGKDDYVALKPLSLAIESKQIFGLLGPNGAGKTTLISVLTGMYPKTSGNAWINGVQVGEGAVNQFIGVCPQFDLLWPTLTVYEHLKFYAMLKGIPQSLIESKIDESLHDVDLYEWKKTQSNQLSGGMQRRLSIAIALVANPSVAFLDQPSSGLDPSHRRKMWDILLRCKNKTSIILTTHLMEEAEALCDRIGIISKGQLKCIGQTEELKDSFGEGYRLHINFVDLLNPRNEQIIDNLCKKFGAQVLNRLDRRVMMKVQKDYVLDCVGWLKKQQRINWLVSQPNLSDVFMNFVE